jgi:hypothetical protein
MAQATAPILDSYPLDRAPHRSNTAVTGGGHRTWRIELVAAVYQFGSSLSSTLSQTRKLV